VKEYAEYYTPGRWEERRSGAIRNPFVVVIPGSAFSRLGEKRRSGITTEFFINAIH